MVMVCLLGLLPSDSILDLLESQYHNLESCVHLVVQLQLLYLEFG